MGELKTRVCVWGGGTWCLSVNLSFQVDPSMTPLQVSGDKKQLFPTGEGRSPPHGREDFYPLKRSIQTFAF